MGIDETFIRKQVDSHVSQALKITKLVRKNLILLKERNAYIKIWDDIFLQDMINYFSEEE